MPSNFLKRKAKASEVKELREESPDMGMQEAKVTIESTPPSYSQEGYDIFTSDGGKTYHVAEIAYNPETRQAVVSNIFDISRLVALSYANQKQALGTLKKGKK